MTEKQAEKQGLEFTGFYRSFTEKDKVKEEAKRIRESGRRAVMVFVPGTRRDGYSVYATPEE